MKLKADGGSVSIADDIARDMSKFGRSRAEAEQVVTGNFSMFTSVRVGEIAQAIIKAVRSLNF